MPPAYINYTLDVSKTQTDLSLTHLTFEGPCSYVHVWLIYLASVLPSSDLLSIASQLMKNSCKMLALHSTGSFSGTQSRQTFPSLVIYLDSLDKGSLQDRICQQVTVARIHLICLHPPRSWSLPKLVMQLLSTTENNRQATSEDESVNSGSDV